VWLYRKHERGRAEERWERREIALAPQGYGCRVAAVAVAVAVAVVERLKTVTLRINIYVCGYDMNLTGGVRVREEGSGREEVKLLVVAAVVAVAVAAG